MKYLSPYAPLSWMKKNRGTVKAMARIKSFISAPVFILLLLSLPLAGADFTDIRVYEKKIYRHFYTGNDFKLSRSLEQMLIKYPDHPLSTLYYEDLNYLSHAEGPTRVEKTIRQMMRRICSKKMTGERNLCLLKLNIELEKLLYPTDRVKALAVTGRLNPIRKWKIAGPFRKYGPGDMEHVFMPEIPGNRGIENSGYRSVVLKNDRGELNLSDHVYPASGTFYATTTVRQDRTFRLRVYSEADYILFINGKRALKNMGKTSRNLRVLSLSGACAYTLTFKLRGSPPGTLRLLLTDTENRIIRNPVFGSSGSTEECNISSEEDFPFYYIKSLEKKDPSRALKMLGSYYLELGSRESVPCFKKSLSLRNDPVTAFLLATALLRLNGGNRDTAWFLEGWRIMNRLYSEHPGFVPAAGKILAGSIETGNTEKALRLGKKLFRSAPFYMPGLIEYLGLLNSQEYDTEFLHVLGSAKKAFPMSVYPILYETGFYETRNRDRYISGCMEILNKKYVPNVAHDLVRAHLSAGEYRKADKLIEKYNYNGEYNDDKVTLLIHRGDLEKARNFIIQRIAQRGVPRDYFNMGLVSFLKGGDPLMYWLKMYSIDPSRFSLAEYINYLNTGSVKNPFSAFSAVPPGAGPGWPDADLQQFPSSVLYHGKTFLLEKGRSSRVFCEEIVYIKNDKGIEQWGDYRVPFRGKFHPVRIRVYRRNGEYSDSYSINRIDSTYYININALEKDSILCISYIIDNPVNSPRYSSLFSIPFMYVQNFEEPVQKVSIRVIAPEECPLKFHISGKHLAHRKVISGRTVYSLDMQNLEPVYYEQNSGSGRNSLPYYSFSSITSMNDFSAWYRGISRDTDSLPRDIDTERFRGASVQETAARVYYFVAQEIELQKNIIYYPEDAENTLYVRKGTPEDKVVLAKSILSRTGIQSYTAFVKSKAYPECGSYITPEMFTHVLLYVPLDRDRCLWFDFSDQYFPCGTVDPALSGQNATVLIHMGSEIVRVKSAEPGMKTSTYRMAIDPDGNASCEITTELRGFYSWYRRRFKKKDEHEKTIHTFFGNMVPAMAADSYKIRNLDDLRKPFVLSARGTAPSFAVTGVNRITFQAVQNKCGVYSYIRYHRRNHPLILSVPINEREEYTYILQPGYRSEEIKKEQEIKTRFGHASLRIIKDKNSSRLLVYKDVFVRSMRVLPRDYKDFLSFCMEIKKIEYQNITVKKN